MTNSGLEILEKNINNAEPAHTPDQKVFRAFLDIRWLAGDVNVRLIDTDTPWDT